MKPNDYITATALNSQNRLVVSPHTIKTKHEQEYLERHSTESHKRRTQSTTEILRVYGLQYSHRLGRNQTRTT